MTWTIRLFACLALGATLTSLAAPAEAAQRRYGVVSFSRIQIDGNFNGAIRVGTSASVTAEGDTAALESLSVEVQNDTLYIRLLHSDKERGASDRRRAPITLAIDATRLDGVLINGNGRIHASGLRENDTMLILRGSGELSADAISTTNLVAALDGAGKLIIAGKANSAKVQIKGSGTADASALAVRDLDVDARGSANGSFSASRRAGVNAQGLATVDISGTAACTVKNSGNGEVYCGR